MPTMAEVVSQAEGRLYQLAYLWSGERTRAHELAVEALTRVLNERELRERVLQASDPAEALVGALAMHLDRRESGRLTLAKLDNILRSDLTDPCEVPSPNDDQGTEALLWELKRTCLTAVLGALSGPQRLGFILTYVFGYGRHRAATLLGIDKAAVSVRNTRALAALTDYLGARCRHVNAHNPCYCRGRLAIAARAGFVRPPPHLHDVPATPCDAGPTRDEPASLYSSLPPIAPTAEQRAQLGALIHAFDAGAMRDAS